MTKAELIEKLHGDLEMDLSKKALGEIVDGLFETMSHAIKDDERFFLPWIWYIRCSYPQSA